MAGRKKDSSSPSKSGELKSGTSKGTSKGRSDAKTSKTFAQFEKSAGDKARRRVPSLFGVESAELSAKALENHIDSAAKLIKAELAALAKDGTVSPRDVGFAQSLHGLWIHDGRQSRYASQLQNYDQLFATITRLHGEGFAPIDLMGSYRLFDPWTVAFGPRPSGGYFWIPGYDQPAFIAKDLELFHAGFRIVSFNRRNGRFNATYAGGGFRDAQWIKWDLDYFGLLAWDRHYRAEGLRIVAIDRYGEGGTLYAAVWRPGDGDQIIEAPGGLNVYFGQPSKFLVYKYEERGLQVQTMGHNGYPVAAYRPKNSRFRQGWIYTSASQFKEMDASYQADGYRLSFISHAAWQFG